MSVAFEAVATLELEQQQLRGRLAARGKDKLGGARFSANATFEVTGDGDTRSIVSTHGEVDITGRLASLIEGGATMVVKRMSADFAACLSDRCTARASA